MSPAKADFIAMVVFQGDSSKLEVIASLHVFLPGSTEPWLGGASIL